MDSNDYEVWEVNHDEALSLLKHDAFEVILDNPGIDCGEWVNCLVQGYTEDVINVFGDDPEDVPSLLTDWWDMENYDDKETGLSKSFSEWSETICNESALSLYQELVEANNRIRMLEDALNAATSDDQE